MLPLSLWRHKQSVDSAGRRFRPELLFALAVMTQGEEFEQCQCITDSFPPSQTYFQTDETTLKSGLFYGAAFLFFLKLLYNLIIPRWEPQDSMSFL